MAGGGGGGGEFHGQGVDLALFGLDVGEEAFALLRHERGELPRATFFVSGPSRTADIEQTIVIGAHGPYRVHVILIP